MWIIVGKKTQSKRIPGGRYLERLCKPCGKVTMHVECDVRDEINAFFLPVFAATQRRMVCVECGEDLAVEEALAAPPPPRRPARISEAEKDDLLAALKKKMGL